MSCGTAELQNRGIRLLIVCTNYENQISPAELQNCRSRYTISVYFPCNIKIMKIINVLQNCRTDYKMIVCTKQKSLAICKSAELPNFKTSLFKP